MYRALTLGRYTNANEVTMFKMFFEGLKANPTKAIKEANREFNKIPNGAWLVEKVDETLMCEYPSTLDVIIEDNTYILVFDNAMYAFLVIEDKRFTFDEKVRIAAKAAAKREVERFYFYTLSMSNMNVYGEESY